ncbi:ATP-binding protein [uncultured Bacteroides sp.]|uniref:sensor histidine kinase n=1 Tax=uncultured Bacteroides sp. TaxID=162156 RepID=UPI002625B2FE|nr:ATP-binding protein [uncultured Bacteroides sp.]
MGMFSRSRLTYHRKLFLGLVIYSWLLVGCFALFQYHREKQFKAEEVNSRLQVLNEFIIAHLDSTGKVELPPCDIVGLRISVIDGNGKVIFDNSSDSLPKASHIDREEVIKAMQTGEGYTLRRHSESTGGTYFYSAKRGKGYLVRTAVPYSMTLDRLLTTDYAFLWFIALVTAGMCVIGFFVTRRVGKHIERLSAFAEKAERGERIVDIEPFPRDELGNISNHIVRLYAKLQQAIAERDREHRQAICEQQEKMRIKRQLTNNINHELKTPVASMQLCLETLIDHKELPVEKREDFINRCYAANKRLQSLLIDVSTLTRIEDGGESFAREALSVSDIVAEICDEYEELARNKGFEIRNKVTPVTINGNMSLLFSIFRNLIDNALAYSEGSLIEIRVLEETDHHVTLALADNGKGVAKEHLPRIFERFYRVDKGRSRLLGGTGLGLSIVKNAVHWHGGTIRAINREQGGLLFVFTLNKQP